MTVTYNLGNDIGLVRLVTGDKILTDPVFTDEEIQAFITAEGSVNLASARLLEAWAAQYSANADSEGIGDYRYSQKIIDNMLKLAGNLREIEAAGLALVPVVDWAEFDLEGLGETE